MSISSVFKQHCTYSFVLLATVFCSTNTNAQNFVSSNLPIVIIQTDLNTEIVDDPKVNATMKIIWRQNNERNYLTDINTPEYLNYNGRIKIEIRGSSSQSSDKKPYGFTTYATGDIDKKNVSLLNLPKENDWILSAINFDPAFMRDYLFYNTARRMGNYASRGEYCEVFVNNDYRGLYILQEKLKVDENRINIATLKKTEYNYPDITGGYIIKADKTTGGDPVAWTMPSYSWDPEYIHEYPKYDDITPQQHEYIYDEFMKLASKAGYHNSSLKDGYATIIDVPSFIDFMLLNELASNPDAYQFSTYFHKDKGGKLRAGPIWDINLSFGNDLFFWGLDRSKYNIWQFQDGENDGAKFWRDLFNTPTFRCQMAKRWEELIKPGQPLNSTQLKNLIDSISNQISEALVREEEKWHTVGDHYLSILEMKQFISKRISWISQNIGSSSNCTGLEMPPLAITKINYHPSELGDTISSSDKEFIEITNAGSTAVNLSGFYLRELGVSYQFPYGKSIKAGESIYIVGDVVAFKKEYALEPFGQFERNLPNDSFKLVLADAFGNEIDAVTYGDRGDWPNEADGLGSFLALKGLSLDNSLATNWEAANKIKKLDPIIEPEEKPTHFALYPNPASTTITIESAALINRIEIFNYMGVKIIDLATNNNANTLNIGHLSAGVYVIRVSDNAEIRISKFIKE